MSKKIGIQIVRDDSGRYKVRKAMHQDDPIFGAGSGSWGYVSEKEWEMLNAAQEECEKFQATLATWF